jgi:hypothetical protein
MPLRGRLKRLERAARGHLASFELEDGSLFYLDPTSLELFDHWCKCIRAGSAHHWPEPPEVCKKLCEAKDPERALEQVHGRGSFSFFVYDPGVLINERRLEPRGLVSERDPQTGEHRPRDPWEHRPTPDLSEGAQEEGEHIAMLEEEIAREEAE